MQSYLAYAACRAVLALVALLPRRIALALVERLADAAYRIDRHHRRIAAVNLRIAFPDLQPAEREAIGRRSFRQCARNLVEVSRIERLTPGTIGAAVEYDPEAGLANLEAARRLGRGILYLTGHFSAWELLPAAHALHGHPLSFVTRPLDNPWLERHLTRLRESSGNTVISKKNSARRILEALRQGREVGLLVDQNTTLEEGVYSDLFGLPAATTTGLALLALRTGAVVVTGYLIPLEGGRYRIRFLPHIDPVRTGDRARDVEAAVAAFNAVLERIIREHPDLWLWGHKRWKNQPGGEDVYGMTEEELERYLSRKKESGVRSQESGGERQETECLGIPSDS